MDSFKKRQKEIRRLERQQEKAQKRKELKARKAAGMAPAQDGTETPADESASQPEAALPPLTN